jgi:GNAT superfamily N-acetyltransferase
MTTASPLTNGYHDAPQGKLATIVTSLEMLKRPAPSRTRPIANGRQIIRQEKPSVDWYRDLFLRVGGPWLWTSRLRMSHEALAAIIHDPAVEVYALMLDGRAEGLLELDFSLSNECRIAFFGVAPGQIGSGAGRLLMDEAIKQAWSRPIHRFWVRTCTLDHPAALAFYQKAGFVPFKRQVEIFDDPRLTSVVPRDLAPHVPLL